MKWKFKRKEWIKGLFGDVWYEVLYDVTIDTITRAQTFIPLSFKEI